VPDEVVTTPFGRFYVDTEDCIGATLKAGTVWDGPGFLQVIAREYGLLGEHGITILDVGANVGGWTVWLAAQGAWRVIAVEPIPLTLGYLRATLDLNKPTCAERVILLPVAAYDQVALLRPVVTPHNLGGGEVLCASTPDGERVTAVPLDRFQWLYGSRVSLIKIDAQGCDGAVIRGLEQTIARDHPVIVFEWEVTLALRLGDTLEATQAWLRDRGYATHEWPSHPNNYLALPEERR
jgi:FkbM family methyltransferase